MMFIGYMYNCLIEKASALSLVLHSHSYILGRALEELRGSLYNDFHTSEGAKRQQQRLCGPIIALTFNFVVAVGIIMANKMVWLSFQSC